MTQWKALKIRVKRRYIDPLSGFLYPRGCMGISYDEIIIDENSTLPKQKEDGLTDVTAYFSFTADSRKIAKELRYFVSGLPRMDGSYAIESVEVQDFGWADKWKEFFSPIRIGRSVTVTPSWEKRRASAGDAALHRTHRKGI
jgi:ribosomal protein L11 methylase PrmA